MFYQSQRGNLSVVATGDTLLTRRMSPFIEPDYLALVDLVRDADVRFTNLETTVRADGEGTPNASEGTIMSTPPELLEELKWFGFNMVSTANNHAMDWGHGGLLATIAHLKRAGIAYAGSGDTLGRARAPGFLDTKQGRVALIAATAHVPIQGAGGDPRPDAPGRPGINPVHYSKSFRVDPATIAALRDIKRKLRLDLAQARKRAHFFTDAEYPPDLGEEMEFVGSNFTAADRFEVVTTADAADVEANLRQIRDAARRADWVLFSFHNPEIGDAGAEKAKSRADMEEPAQFAVDFARAAADAGAHMVICHGPHIAMGVEVYKGVPIMHSLGNFFLQNDTVTAYPADAYKRFGLDADATPADFLDTRSHNDTKGFAVAENYWRSVVAKLRFSDRKLVEFALHPVDIGFGTKRAERGRPMLARGASARTTLERVSYLSERYGTTMRIDNDVATVALD